MAIKPIDLQALLARMNEISKGQAYAKEHVALLQSQASETTVAKEMENDRKITESPENEQATEVKDEEPQNQNHSKNNKKDKKKKGEKVILTDPDVGKNINLTG